jgi:hypothetical protein
MPQMTVQSLNRRKKTNKKKMPLKTYWRMNKSLLNLDLENCLRKKSLGYFYK